METTCSAFLQGHARKLYARAGTGKRLLSGTKVGAWRVRDRCREHHKTQSTTYSVINDVGGEHAALTVFETPALAFGSYARRILSIAQILTQVDHAGAVSIVDVGLTADGRPYAVTELHDGVTLAERLQDGARVDRLHAVTILRGICASLIAAHEVGVVHGSLELGHVLLADGDERYVKLLDWGVERAISDEARRAGVERATGASWMAPEEILGITSPRTDAFALGAVAFQLLFGPVSSEANGSSDAASSTVIGGDEQPGELEARVAALEAASPRSLEALVGKLLAADPRARPTLDEVAQRLETIARELTRPSVPDTRPPVLDEDEGYPSIEASRRWMLAWGALGSIAAIVAMFIVTHAADEHVGIAGASATGMTATGVTETGAVMTGGAGTDAAGTGAVTTGGAGTDATGAATGAVVTGTTAIATVAKAPVAAPGRERSPMRTVTPRLAPDTVRMARARPAHRRVENTSAPSDDGRAKLLTQYQRIGHDLIELRKQRGAAINELWEQFDALRIHHALATAKTRAAAAATLSELRVRIDRNKAVQPSPACMQNALAEGCR
jgi:hypothetical protein